MAKTKNKRLVILNAATEIFAQKGFHNANISDIADAAQVGKGTIYEYFESKDQLFTEVVEHNFKICFKFIKNQIESAHDFESKINVFINSNFKIIDKNIKMLRFTEMRNDGMYLKSETKQSLIHIISEYKQKLIQIIMDIFSMGQEEGNVRDINKQLIADIFINIVLAYSMRVLNQNDELKIERERKQLVEFIKYGIYKI